MAQSTKGDDALPSWLVFLRELGTLFWAIGHIVGALFEWISTALNLHSERLRDYQLDAGLDDEASRLYQTVRMRAAAATSLNWSQLGERFSKALEDYDIDRDDALPATPLVRAFFKSIWKLYQEEGTFTVDPPPSGDAVAKARYIDTLVDQANRLKDPEARINAFVETAAKSFANFVPTLSGRAFASDEENPPTDFATTSLLDTIDHIGAALGSLIIPFVADEVRSLRLFSSLTSHYDRLAASGSAPNVETFNGSRRQLVDAYLAGTPFLPIFETPVPFNIPTSRLLEHCVIVAGTGHGKTQTLGAMIANHLTQKEPPALVVIDSTGALINKVQSLALFNDTLKDRILIIDPEHDPLPALNMFDISNPRLQGYSASMRDSIESEIVSLFNYIFTSAQNDLTSRQGTVFSYVVRLVLSMPNSNIHTLLDILEEDPKGGYPASRYREQIETLDATARSFFKNQYFGLKSFREQIAGRLYDLVKVGAFEKMFTTRNRVDFYDELQNKGTIILINTSERVLKGDASTLFGRYAIARTMAAAFERAAIPEQKRRPTFLIVDEAAPYFDDTFDKILTRVRQYKLGVCLAFQHMEQASEKLRSSIASNTSVKLAGGLGYTDSRWLARDMETTPEFLKAQHRDQHDPPQWTQLACYVKNYTPSAVSVTVPFYVLENMPQMTAAEHSALSAQNADRVSAPLALPPSVTIPTPTVPLSAETTVVAVVEPNVPGPSAAPTERRARSTDEDAASQWS